MCCLHVSYVSNAAPVLMNSAGFVLAIISPLSFVVTVFIANYGAACPAFLQYAEPLVSLG